MKEIIIDSFAGGGGASQGIRQAGLMADIAINHNAEAIVMHEANHPETKHFCKSVYDVDPLELAKPGMVGLLWASPDCTHFSKAKGGKPRKKEIRDLAHVVVDYARVLIPRVIILENVEEFQGWGPLDDEGFPIKARSGESFQAWVADLRNLGYKVEWKELRACDYGAPTIRKRLFVIARRDGKSIIWPRPTHGPGLKHFRTAAEIIDWSLPCPSIFERKKPLADATLRRIARGIVRYVLEAQEPFILSLTHHGAERVYPLTNPLNTVTGAHRGEMALSLPFVARVDQSSGANRNGIHSPKEPLNTIHTVNPFSVVAPTLIQSGFGERSGQEPRAPGLHKPLGTVMAEGTKHALVAGFLARHFGGPNGYQNDGKSLDDPMGTVTSIDHHALITAPFISQISQTGRDQERSREIEKPLSTVVSKAEHLLLSPHLTHFYSSGHQDGDLSKPMKTITGGGTHAGLVAALLENYAGYPKSEAVTLQLDGVVYSIADIGMRMLSPRELFRAQGFPDSYIIDPLVKGKPMTKTAQVRCCGNSVCPDLAEALIRANFKEEILEASA